MAAREKFFKNPKLTSTCIINPSEHSVRTTSNVCLNTQISDLAASINYAYIQYRKYARVLADVLICRQWCSGGGTRGNAVPPNILLEERRSPTYYQDMGER